MRRRTDKRYASMTTELTSVAKIMGASEQMTLESLDNLDKASTPGCLRRRCQVDAEATRAVAGAAHGKGAEREARRIV
jgi:hypothetical protein